VLPTLLLQSGYSRDFEDEADSYAFQRLKAVGVSPRNLAEILERLEASRGKGTQGGKPDQGERTFDYLSTHPATARRIERALANQ
jgi:predicted Zn-dependent protease